MSANIKLMISQAPIVACFHLKVNDLSVGNHLPLFFLRAEISVREKISIENAKENLGTYFLS